MGAKLDCCGYNPILSANKGISMAYKCDLESVNIWGIQDPGCLAVGWLDPRHPYSRGIVPEEVFRKLCSLAVNPWAPYVDAGMHHCGFCRFTGGPTALVYEGISVPVMGKGYFCIPSGNELFVAPVTILHYVDAHEYSPPRAFLEAVLKCPEMRSMDYFKHLLTTPVRSLLPKTDDPGNPESQPVNH